MKNKDLFGALPLQHLLKLKSDGFITADKDSFKPSSLDLTITDEIYEISGSFQVPYDYTVLEVIKALKGKKVSMDNPLVVGKCYIAKIAESFDLPSEIYGYANPKSTTGRLDIHARLLSDNVPQNDAIGYGFDRELWVHIKPQSFSVRLRAGIALNQIRLFYSDTRLGRTELEALMKSPGLLFSDEKLIRYKDMQIKDGTDSIMLTLDGKVGSGNEPIGFRAKKKKEVIDYDKQYPAFEFFEAIEANENGMIFLEKDCFSILSSAESVSVPGGLACEMASIDDRFGEFRSHYAGFIDPGWGWNIEGTIKGRPLTLEVRPFENVYVRDGQPIARIKYEHLAEKPTVTYDSMNSNYLLQKKAKLAKQFVF